jgi:hypothetical protein
LRKLSRIALLSLAALLMVPLFGGTADAKKKK